MLYILQYMLHVTIHVSVQYLFCFNTQLVVIHVIHITIHASCYNTCVRSILILFQYTSYMLYILQYMLHVTIHVSVQYLFCFNTQLVVIHVIHIKIHASCYNTCPFNTYSVSIHVMCFFYDCPKTRISHRYL